MFVNVAKAVCDHREDVHFVIIGDGPERASIESQISSLGMDGHIHLLGTRMTLHSLWRGSICSSSARTTKHRRIDPRSAGLSGSSHQHASWLGSRIGVRWRNGIFGRARRRRDNGTAHSQLAGKNASLRQRLGRAGRKRVLQTGSLEAMSKATLD